MTNRNELIQQAEQAIKAAIDDPTAPPTIVAWQAANAIITKGWRPSPSGDVVEAAARAMASLNLRQASGTLELATAIADAGLLRTPPQQDAREVYRAWSEEGLGWVAGMQNTNWREAWRDVGQALGEEPADE